MYERTSWRLRDVIKKKTQEPDYELDITSQDLSDYSEISIPYFMEAKAKYNELIKSNKDVNYYFKKIIERV